MLILIFLESEVRVIKNLSYMIKGNSVQSFCWSDTLLIIF